MKNDQPDLSRRSFLRSAAVGTTVGAAAVVAVAQKGEAAVLETPVSSDKTPESAHMSKYYDTAKF